MVISEGRGHDLLVERYEDMKHGWTQMTPSWLSEKEKKTRLEIFEKTVAFTRSPWDIVFENIICRPKWFPFTPMTARLHMPSRSSKAEMT